MNIARPVDGFRITWPPTVAALIDSQNAVNPNFQRYWDDVIERLKFTAHREGTPEPRLGKGYKLIVINGIQSEGRPRLAIGYLVLGDHVKITLLRIS